MEGLVHGTVLMDQEALEGWKVMLIWVALLHQIRAATEKYIAPSPAHEFNARPRLTASVMVSPGVVDVSCAKDTSHPREVHRSYLPFFSARFESSYRSYEVRPHRLVRKGKSKGR
jgi:hypothetical protein